MALQEDRERRPCGAAHDQFSVHQCAGWQTLQDGKLGVAVGIVGCIAAPETPAARVDRGQGADSIPLDLEAVLGESNGSPEVASIGSKVGNIGNIRRSVSCACATRRCRGATALRCPC